MPALLSRILNRIRESSSARHRSAVAGPPEPVPFGPRYALAGERLSVETGPLAGTTLRFERTVTGIKADFALFLSAPRPPSPDLRPLPSDPLGHCHFDRDPETGLETFWDVFIRAEFRHQGITTLLTRIAFRELLSTGRRHWFAIRKLMQIDTGDGRHGSSAAGHGKSTNITLQNLGIGMVALRLGFRPEPDLERMLSPGNVTVVQSLAPDPPIPPGLLLRINTQPGLLVAAMLDPDTGRPYSDPEAYQRFVSPGQILRQAMSGQAVVGNIDYVLPRANLEQLAVRLADNRTELRQFTTMLRRAARN